LREFNVAYFTASCDTVDDNTKFAKELGLDYPILSDPDRKTARMFGVVESDDGYPKRWTFFIGKDGKLLEVDKQVRPSSHGPAIAKKLAQLGVEKAE
jgi:peroxiredoxin Q/BCP